MKTLDIARRAGRNLGRAKLRTFLTSVAIERNGRGGRPPVYRPYY